MGNFAFTHGDLVRGPTVATKARIVRSNETGSRCKGYRVVLGLRATGTRVPPTSLEARRARSGVAKGSSARRKERKLELALDRLQRDPR